MCLKPIESGVDYHKAKLCFRFILVDSQRQLRANVAQSMNEYLEVKMRDAESVLVGATAMTSGADLERSQGGEE
jgi:hypothetical protein